MTEALKVKGETSIEIAGRTFRLAYSFPAMAVYQQERGETFFEFGARISETGIPLDDVPWLFWLALLEHHGDEFKGPDGQVEARRYAQAFGVPETVTAVGAAMSGAFPSPKAEGGKRPQAQGAPTKSPGT